MAPLSKEPAQTRRLCKKSQTLKPAWDLSDVLPEARPCLGHRQVPWASGGTKKTLQYSCGLFKCLKTRKAL